MIIIIAFNFCFYYHYVGMTKKKWEENHTHDAPLKQAVANCAGAFKVESVCSV